MHLPRGRYHRSRFSIVLLSFSKFPCEEKTRSIRLPVLSFPCARSLARPRRSQQKRFFFVLLWSGITFSPFSLLLWRCARGTLLLPLLLLLLPPLPKHVSEERDQRTRGGEIDQRFFFFFFFFFVVVVVFSLGWHGGSHRKRSAPPYRGGENKSRFRVSVRETVEGYVLQRRVRPGVDVFHESGRRDASERLRG